jgi:predicted RNA binding protein YcfA (HicA-like mRNA interferase family)
LGRLKPYTYREIRRKLLASGFIEVSQKGSHVKLSKVTPEGTRIVIVPCHTGDIPMGTLRSILNQAGLSPDEFEVL